jgi:hypothetical protein
MTALYTKTDVRYDDNSLNSSQNENVLDKRCRGNQNTHLIFNQLFPKIVPFMRGCEKNMAERARPQMAM